MHNQSNRILFVWVPASFEEIVKDDDLVDLFAFDMETVFDMFLHFLDDPCPFLFDEVDVLLLIFFVVLPFQFVLDLLHGVDCQVLEVLLDLGLHVLVVVIDLGHLVDLLFVLFDHAGL